MQNLELTIKNEIDKANLFFKEAIKNNSKIFYILGAESLKNAEILIKHLNKALNQ